MNNTAKSLYEEMVAADYVIGLESDYAKQAQRIKQLEEFIQKIAALSGDVKTLELYREAQEILRAEWI
jgi:hypothetical protein